MEGSGEKGEGAGLSQLATVSSSEPQPGRAI